MPLPPTLEQATRKAGVVWLALDGGTPQLVWHLWHEGCLWVISGGLEQQLPGSHNATRAAVTVRGKDIQVWEGDVTRIAPADPEWSSVVALLHDRRLNAPDGEAQPERWARESLLLRISP